MKRIEALSILLAILLTVGACTFSASADDEHPALLAGDADRDGEVTIVDATKIQRFVAELDELDDLTQQVAKNEFSAQELTILDATNLQNWVAELYSPTTYEVGQQAFVWQDDHYISVVEKYQEMFDKMLEDKDYYGVLYITRNKRVLTSSAYGEGISIDTQFPVGSISKQFCGTAVAICQERGLLSVDDTLEKYFPDYTIGKDITIKNLLQMRSGIPDFMNDAQPMVDYQIKETYTAEENKAVILDWLYAEELDFKPGTRGSYSNTNYFLLAEIVERVSGMKYSEFVKENIFKPLHMDNSGFYEELYGAENLAGFRVEGFDPLEPHFKGLTQGAGDIVSCAKDMDKWLTSFKTHSLLSANSYEQITTPVQGYGYGWSVDSDGCLSHLGRIAAYLSQDYTDPSIGYNFFSSTTVLNPQKAESSLNKLYNTAILQTR